jgi:hypothetical protein
VEKELGAPLSSFSSGRGELSVWSPARGIYVTQARVHIDTTLAAKIVAAGDRVVERDGRLTAFHDWEAVESYDTEARLHLTSWGFRIRKQVDKVHILQRSKLLKMGVSVASIALAGMIVSHEEREPFESVLLASLRATLRPRS